MSILKIPNWKDQIAQKWLLCKLPKAMAGTSESWIMFVIVCTQKSAPCPIIWRIFDTLLPPPQALPSKNTFP